MLHSAVLYLHVLHNAHVHDCTYISLVSLVFPPSLSASLFPSLLSMTGVTGFGKLLLIAALAEDALLLKHKHRVLQLLLAAGADEVLRMPAPPHGSGVWSSGKREREGREKGREEERERQGGRRGEERRKGKRKRGRKGERLK